MAKDEKARTQSKTRAIEGPIPAIRGKTLTANPAHLIRPEVQEIVETTSAGILTSHLCRTIGRVSLDTQGFS